MAASGCSVDRSRAAGESAPAGIPVPGIVLFDGAMQAQYASGRRLYWGGQ